MAALTSDELTRWRSSPAAFPVYAWVHRPAVVFAARVNQASFTYPLTSITYDTVTTGAYTDIEAGMTLCIGSTAGAWDLGRVRIKAPNAGAVADATKVYFQRVSQGNRDGEADPGDNLYLTVYNLRLLWAKPPFITPEGVLYMEDDRPFVAATHRPPVANAGPDVLKIVPVGTTSATVDFGQTASHIWSEDNISTYAWDFRDGTPSTSSDAAPTGVSFPLGKRYVKLTVTDAAGVSSTAYALVVVVDEADTDLIEGMSISQHTERIDGGSMVIDLSAPLSVSDYPDGTEVLVCSNVVANQEGLSDRQHMVFAGWLGSEESSVSTARNFIQKRTRLNVLSAADRLKELPLWKTTLVRKTSPTKWSEVKYLSLDRLVLHALMWHSSVLERVDLLPNTVSAWSFLYNIVGVDIPDGNVWDSISQFVQAAGGLLTCDRYNRLRMVPDQQLATHPTQDAALFTAAHTRSTANRLDLTEADVSSLGTSFARHPRYHWVWSEALIANLNDYPATSAPFFIVAPGPAPAQGAGEQRITKQVIQTVPEFRWREGNRYAARENAMKGLVRLDLVRPLPAIHPADVEWVRLTSAQAGAYRVRAMTNERLLPVEVQYRYDHASATRQVSVTLESEVIGWAAPTYIPASYSGVQQQPRLEFPRPTIPNTGAVNHNLNRGNKRIAAICGNGLARTTNFGDGDSVVWDWRAWSHGSLGMGNGIKVFTPDAFSYTDGGDIVGWVTNSNNAVFYLNITQRTATNKDTWTGGSLNIDSSILNRNFVIVCITESFGGKGRVSKTVDNSTWTEVDYAPSGPLGAVYPSCVFISQRTPGKAWAHGQDNVYVTTDYGASWAVETAIDFNHDPGYDQIYSPFTVQNPSEAIWFVSAGEHSQVFRRLNGLTVTDIRPNYGGYYWNPYARRNGFSTAATDANKLLLAGWRSGGTFQIFLTTNALTTPTWTPIANTTGLNFGSCAIAGDSANTFYFWSGWTGSNAAIAYSPDNGVNIISQVGNLASFSPGPVHAIAGW